MCVTEELAYWEWVGKLTEKLTFIRLKVGDRKEISEEDYGLLECLHKLYFNGEYPLYQTKLDLVAEKACQNGLFDAISTTEVPKEGIGTDFVSTSTN
jgi:hypothetical protein